MRHVVFKTPGLIDIRAFTIMGLSSKPGSDAPIGKFGTGLKMAIAVLVRNNITVSLWIGRTHYYFRRERAEFRGQEYQQVVMFKEVHGVRKILSKTKERLPFTTELGKFWDLWQAYRELESNTRDENGETTLWTAEPYGPPLNSQEETAIVVSGEKFVQEYLDRDKTFLPDGLTVRDESTPRVQVLNRASPYIYWRGIRVHDLPKESPSALTYNILEDIELTEDRTAKDAWMLEYVIKSVLVQSEDPVIAEAVTEKRETPSWENTITFDTVGARATPTFLSAASRPTAHASVQRLAAQRLKETQKEDPWKEFPRPWRINESGVVIEDANGKKVCSTNSAMIACAILNKVNEQDIPF